MEHQTPDQEHGSSPSQDARVEDDFVRHLTPTKVSPRRFAASLPLAIVSILVVATVAFGATVIRPLVLGPMASATPVVVGDDGPDGTPDARADGSADRGPRQRPRPRRPRPSPTTPPRRTR